MEAIVMVSALLCPTDLEITVKVAPLRGFD